MHTTELKKFTQLYRMKYISSLFFTGLFLVTIAGFSQNNPSRIITGAERTEVYFPLLKGKKVGVFANQTSTIGTTHLVDSLIRAGIKVVAIFGPEHGFRGKAEAGEEIKNATDSKTGIPVISLYGDHKKPTPADLRNIDVMVFDIQDVGVRFYTYISSLELVMEAALENHKPLLILDRPNPNGFYVDGPVLDKKFKSFIGMQAIPVVYGLTIGEYALMLTGENWLSEKANAINAYNIKTKPGADTPFHIQVIKCKNYDHNSRYILHINPSPNLKTAEAIYLYPSTCFFEGTILNEGRGTDKPFQQFGHPLFPTNLHAYTPKPNDGAKTGKCFNRICYGWDVTADAALISQSAKPTLQLKYILESYRLFPGKDSFFLKTNTIDKVAGSDLFQQQVKKGLSEGAIRESWEPGLTQFRILRKKYLLYTDFE